MNKRMTLTELLVEYDGGLWRMLGKQGVHVGPYDGKTKRHSPNNYY